MTNDTKPKFTQAQEKVSYSDLEEKKWIVEVMQSSTKNKVTKFLHRVFLMQG